MAVKKTELYSSLWASCDALRGGMDASQYKDYILTLLFMKYVTDKYKGQKYGDLTVFDKANDPNPDPQKRTGCSFDDFIALKNKKNIGEGIDKIIARLAEVNEGLKGVIDIAHFNDEAKIGKDKEMVDKLTKLIAIFQRPELDFSKNKVEGDDIIGDAYEYLMRNFASESGKSKGQFYTPAEVSRILAKIIGIDKCTDHDATVCDPACGSGSLLIRALAEAPFEISGYGQEKDGSTAGLAKMNAVLHNKATIRIMAGNTFSDPQFMKSDNPSELERFDYIVANPPFSLKNWSDGLKEFGRFSGYGDRPPEKNGDYAWLMHILKTLKSTGKAAVILPHGVLFRGNAEATIRQTIVDKGWIKGIISLPPNLFYGTGIPACILVIDKEGAENRAGIFMIDAGKGYVKDGSKNRLREQDIYRIVTTFNEQITTDLKYARFVPNKEIKEKNGYNLNISRYIDSSAPEDIQDIYAHIHGGIPAADIDALERFWTAFPTLKNELFGVFSEGYYKLNVEEDVIRQTTYSNAEFAVYGEMIDEVFANWKSYADSKLKNLKAGVSAKELIIELAQAILKEFESLSLINKYDVYQVLLAYWNEVLSDDVSMIISDEAGYGVARETENIMKETKKKDDDGNQELKVAGWEGKLIPKALIISELFPEEKKAMDDLVDFVVETDSRLMSLVEESAEDSVLSDVAEGGKVKSKDIQEKMDEIMSHVHTPLIDGLVKLQGMLPMKKKEYVDYISNNIILEVAYTEKGTVTKTSVAYALAMARAEAPAPEAYADDYAELKAAFELAKKSEESTKLIKDLFEENDIAEDEQEITYPEYTVENYLDDVYMSEEDYTRLVGLLRNKKNIILQGAPGVGKTYAAKRLAYSMMGVKDVERVMMVQFHQSYSYEDFIMGFRPSPTGFELKKGAFYNFCKKAEIDSDNEYFFIIDEINRGNLSKIFGELFMLIENDKRGIALQLLYSDEKFAVPKNVYIIGMMNTADRSLAMLDYALRRRFGFFDIKPGFESTGFREYRMALDNEKFNKLISCVESLNREISADESLGEGFCIGHSYFCNLKPDAIEDSWFYGVVEYELIPLLKEYWFDEPMKVKDWSENLRSTIK